ncbi:uncharacterized protein MEPE_00536 [Melanopsichium pennsylvanicum]|uniref:FHA domain-containing protein n=2 Tax=Melanopsichium pennsylvanicum TaxID=63383 RepID=A0AAJ4XGW5_9BASI|nr:putative protein [Melanopsichium pennsylvanicum 4]SNX81831.1 uncharacterized protein MEPE_00536 [Melanopsichium pennsylvanicum]
MLPESTTPSCLELVWVNASAAGPLSYISPASHQVIRIPAGQEKMIARSNSMDRASLVNDLSNHIYFPLAKVVSREHAVIQWLDGLPVIRNLGSTHGTYVARRQATVSSKGDINETDPAAPRRPVDGAIPLRPGDLIEFGKTCVRTDSSYHPVRCYVRFVFASPGTGPSQPPPFATVTAAVKPFSLIDDPFDSESDIVSIDAETFRAGSVTQSSPQPSQDRLSAKQPVILSDSEDDVRDEAGSAFSSSEEQSSESDKDDSCLKDDRGELSEPLDIQHVSWLHEITEVADERSELDREASEARKQGEHYMQSYIAGHLSPPETPATSVAEHVPEPSAEVKYDLSEAASEQIELDRKIPEGQKQADDSRASQEQEASVICLAEDVDRSRLKGATAQSNENIAGNIFDPAGSTATSPPMSIEATLIRCAKINRGAFGAPSVDHQDQPEKAEQQVSRKRKEGIATIDDWIEQSASDDNESSSDFESDSFASKSLASCSSTSYSPSPSKKRRIGITGPCKHRHAPRTSSRARAIRAFATKVLYTTSLISVGFLTGSLFTFKSMMNAAAVANTAGGDKQ